MSVSPSPEVLSQIAPEGYVRIALNLANPLLAEGPVDSPKGVTVDLSHELAKSLGVDVVFEPFTAAGKVVDALKAGSCDVAFMAIDQSRAADFSFSPAYMLIEAAYAVPRDSAFHTPSDVDARNVRILSAEGAAYTQYLVRTLKNAELVASKNAFEALIKGEGQVVAGVRQPVSKFVAEQASFRMIEERFMEIPQGVAVRQGQKAAAQFLCGFIETMKSSGFIAESLRRHGHHDAVVAPAELL